MCLINILTDLLPPGVRRNSVASYMAVIHTVGGTIALLVSPIQIGLFNSGLSQKDSLKGQYYPTCRQHNCV